jgi:hypothetical protein
VCHAPGQLPDPAGAVLVLCRHIPVSGSPPSDP